MIRVAVANGCQSPLDLVIFPALKLDVIGVLGGFAFQEDLFEEQFGIIFLASTQKRTKRQGHIHAFKPLCGFQGFVYVHLCLT